MLKFLPIDEAISARAPAFVTDAVRQALPFALGQASSEPLATSPFPTVWCLQKWAEAVERECWPAWVERLGIGSAIDATPPAEEDSVAWSFALGWHLATGSREHLAGLVRRHQAMFNRATEVHCTPELHALRRSVRTHHKVTPEEVEKVVAALTEGDIPVTYLAVGEALGISAARVANNKVLRAAVDRAAPVVLARWYASMKAKLTESRDRLVARGARLSRANLAVDAKVSLEAIARFEKETGETLAVSPREEYGKLVAGAIAALRQRNARVTTAGVARELGRERSFIEKNPDLKRMVHAARDAKPTVEDVRRACKEILARGEEITIVGVAEVIDRGREVIERSEMLRAAIDAEIAEHRRIMEERTTAATRLVFARDGGADFVTVARELGVVPGYLVRNVRLYEIVYAVQREERARARSRTPG